MMKLISIEMNRVHTRIIPKDGIHEDHVDDVYMHISSPSTIIDDYGFLTMTAKDTVRIYWISKKMLTDYTLMLNYQLYKLL